MGLTTDANGLAKWVNDGVNKYDFALAGIPFYSGIDDSHPYLRQTSAFKKDQIDTAVTPGEQSLQGWWYRSQNSADLGAGIVYNDTLRDDTIVRRFRASCNVDVFSEPGKVKLLPGLATVRRNDVTPENPERGWRQLVAAKAQSYDASNLPGLGAPKEENAWGMYAVYRGDDFDHVYVVRNGTVANALPTPDTDEDDEVHYWVPEYEGQPGPRVNSIVGIAGGVVIATQYGCYMQSNGTYTAKYSNVLDLVDVAKERLWCADGRYLWHVDATPANGAMETLTSTKSYYKHADPTWKWVAIAEGPNRVYFAGSPDSELATAENLNASNMQPANHSIIYATGLDQQGNSNLVQTLYAPVAVAELPDGEYISSMISYLGTYLILGTSAGVRVALMDGNGGLVVGPLVCETVNPVEHLSAYNNFVWAAGQPRIRIQENDGINVESAATQWLAASPTLIKIDLSKITQANSLMFAWSEDQSYPGPNIDAFSAIESLGTAKPKAIPAPSIFGLVVLSQGPSYLGGADKDAVRGDTKRGPVIAMSYHINVEREKFLAAIGGNEESAYCPGGAATVIASTENNGTYVPGYSNAHYYSGFFQGGIVVTDNNSSRPWGAIQTGRIRFDTSENKIFQYLRSTFESSIDNCRVAVAYSADNGTKDYIFSETLALAESDAMGAKSLETRASDAQPHHWISYLFELRSPWEWTDETQTTYINLPNPVGAPHFTGYQVKAQPANVRQRMIQIPFLMYPREASHHGKIVERSVTTRLFEIEKAEELNAVVLFQDFGTGETRPVLIEELKYLSDFMPETRVAKADRPGLLLVTLRTINTLANDTGVSNA
jgi:hypothetical protein